LIPYSCSGHFNSPDNYNNNRNPVQHWGYNSGNPGGKPNSVHSTNYNSGTPLSSYNGDNPQHADNYRRGKTQHSTNQQSTSFPNGIPQHSTGYSSEETYQPTSFQHDNSGFTSGNHQQSTLNYGYQEASTEKINPFTGRPGIGNADNYR
jgi:hypothetical protein